jgi:type IV secretory pathway TraG/TraD family ATPase VirD4
MTALPAFFADSRRYPLGQDSVFVGLDDLRQPIGVDLERHALTIAGSGAGKGACLLIPNALRWPHNLLAVDPKGENAARTWQAREALGQSVHVLDPFRVADVPDRLRAAFNPLQAIRAESPTGREDCEVVADGLVKRSDPKHDEWYDGAVALLAGLIAYVVETAPVDHQNLTAVRAVLSQDDEALNADAQRMQGCTAFGGLAREAGLTIRTALEATKGMEKDFLSGARRATRWLDSPPIAATLTQSSFALADLKQGRASVYLVLPPQYLDTHAAYLRMFVRSAISAMMAEGTEGRGRCLFLLDEFYSLGRLDIVAKSAGLMRSYGLHLWPFLQDIGQLRSLYGRDLSETFFANADAVMFFGNDDGPTLEEISRRLGTITAHDIEVPAPITSPSHTPEESADSANQNAAYQRLMALVGTPRIPPDKVAAIIGKPPAAKVAIGMLLFAKAGQVLYATPAPYFANSPAPSPAQLPSILPDHHRIPMTRFGEERRAREHQWHVEWDERRVAEIRAVKLRIWRHNAIYWTGLLAICALGPPVLGDGRLVGVLAILWLWFARPEKV